MKLIGVIPARLASTRLSAKVLRNIHGIPMIQHVWNRVKQACELDEVVIACDDSKVFDCAQAFGANALMTKVDHPNGSSRVAEVASKLDGNVYINVQGDEPLIEPEAINQLAKAFKEDESVQVGTLAVQTGNAEEYGDPNTVKVVCDEKGNALYFSRSPIPYERSEKKNPEVFLKHLGIYGYRKDFLLNFVRWQESKLEQTEKLEQLRILEKGVKIKVVKTVHDSPSVDTEEDLRKVEALIK